jgi:hypothetical protein
MKAKPNMGGTVVAGSAYRCDRVRQLMRRIKSGLEMQRHRVLTCEELGMMCGHGHSAVCEKLNRVHQPQVEALLAWLERLSLETRYKCVESACRVYPTVEHPRISHDPTTASRLKSLLSQPNGLTVIQGGDPARRTFLATALGHSFGILRKSNRVLGIDAHEPDWFVPLEDVIYMPSGSERIAGETVVRIWNSVARVSSGLLIINGIWPFLTHFADQVFEAASKLHVVLADDHRFEKPSLVSRVEAPVHILRVREGKQDRLLILVD